MELAAVKARVKAWEKAFKAQHGRAPVKDDIKRDGDIADQYALYRSLSKSTTSNSQPSASSSSRPASNGSDALDADVTRTPSRRRLLPPAPATPTPPAARRSVSAALFSASTSASTSVPGEAGPSRPKRTAADMSPTTPRKMTSTPKRAKPGYTGPVHDPNPNPFSVTPRKGGSATKPTGLQSESPFIYANSPRKMRDLLQANSLHASRDRAAVENTPRTRARKRLAGEEVDPTPAKAPRRRRGDRPTASGATGGSGAGLFAGALPAADFGGTDEEEELDETPMKPFTLVHSADKRKGANKAVVSPTAKLGGRGIDLFPMFQLAKRAAEQRAADPPSKRRASGHSNSNSANNNADRRHRAHSPEIAPSSPSPEAPSLPDAFGFEGPSDWTNAEASEVDADVSASAPPSDAHTPSAASDTPAPDDRLSTPPAGSPPVQTQSQRTPRRERHRARVLALSEDEWDPEADPRMVRVTGTRRQAIKLRPDAGVASDDDDEDDADDDMADSADEGESQSDGEDGDEQDDGDEAEDEATDADAAGGSGVRRASAPAGLLSLLSLRSPIARRGERLADLRVRALLDPTSAAAAMLRAQKRGQDVYVSGEAAEGEEDDEWGDNAAAPGGGGGVVGEGDDDWESDPEGWKAVASEEEW